MSEVVAEQPFQVKGGAYLKDLQKLVSKLEDDLRERSQELPEVHADLTTRYNQARSTERTLETFESWRDEYLTQVAVGWVLTSVFLRYLEDNNLIDTLWLSGPGERIKRARDQRTHYFQQHPTHTDREYMQEAFRSVAQLPGCEALFGTERNPLWLLGPSGDLAKEMVAFWQAINPETGELLRVFGDPQAETIADTRFLGDLYQDLSEAARSRFALLQTPDFVEEFILDRTLEPAIETFGLEGIRMLDPTCGSGHFLLSGFARILEHRHRAYPGESERVRVQKALDGVYGVDLNPFAVAIARFRLLVAALNASGIKRLKDAPNYHLHVAAGDSLLHGRRFGRGGQGLLGIDKDWLPDAFATGDFEEATSILSQQYHAVVGNPPYIVDQDKAHNAAVRERYATCHRQFSLAVPFKELFFDKCVEGQRAGFMGMITANSFMKREFGRKLIEEFLPLVDLTHVIDTSGAYIPGHGTPTVILLGRSRAPSTTILKAALGIRGEPGTPDDPRNGKVWRSILENIDKDQVETAFITVTGLDRKKVQTHPWSLTGGGASALKEFIETAPHRLGQIIDAIGRTTVVGEDDAWIFDQRSAKRRAFSHATVPLVVGTNVRDWAINEPPVCIYPYKSMGGEPIAEADPVVRYHLWRYRALLSHRTVFGKTFQDRGIPWFLHLEHYAGKLKTPLAITFAEVATHNHFVLDRGGKVFKQTAPVIKLPDGASEDEHHSILGPLNSSVGCFWLKQVCFPKGGNSDSHGWSLSAEDPWDRPFQFNSTNVQDFPLPDTRPLELTRRIDDTIRKYVTSLADSCPSRGIRSVAELNRLSIAATQYLEGLIGLQEELDWSCYEHYGIIKPEQQLTCTTPPLLCKGERAFEILLARKVASGDSASGWFRRHKANPRTTVDTDWPTEYQSLVTRRMAAIESDRNLGLLEGTEYKRRWQLPDFWQVATENQVTWLLDKIELRLSCHVEPVTTTQLAEDLAKEDDFLKVAKLYTGRDDFDLTRLITDLINKEDVPYLGALRYTTAGLRKRVQWEDTWSLQRLEDAGEDISRIPIPPKYSSNDFLKSHYWNLRGKLDVPKERFISYPLAEREADPSPVIGWAGWNDLERAKALATYYLDRKEQDGWESDRLTPLLAGLLELIPWLKQWHNDIDPDTDQRLGDFYESFLDDEARSLGLTMQDLRDWRPPAQTKGRKKK